MSQEKPSKPTKATSSGFSDVEKEAMKERAKELKAQKNKKEAEGDLLAKIAEMPEPDRGIAKKIHSIIKEIAPGLSSRTWYGMPAYANKDGKVVCFFQSASKFKTRYSTFGFLESAKLDDGEMWPVSFAVIKLTPAAEKKIAAMVKKALKP